MKALLDISRIPGIGFRFVLESRGQSFSHVVSEELPASTLEDLRLLRWQAIGLVYNGDDIFQEVGERLSRLFIPESERSVWLEALATANRLVIRFGLGTELLLNLPWELLRIEGAFFLRGESGHITREIAGGGRFRMDPQRASVLHVTLGTDSALHLDEERCALLDIIPSHIPATFLLNPTLDEFREAAAVIEASIIVISGHGSYADLSELHFLETMEGSVPTQDFIRAAGESGCGLLLLWTCESARLGAPPRIAEGQYLIPDHIISFTYPVANDTALRAMERLFKRLFAGEELGDVAASVRNVNFLDSYAFFNLVHYQRSGTTFGPVFAPHTESGGRTPSSRCGGRELELTVLDVRARDNPVVTLVAPVGCRADLIVKHWNALNRQSATGRSAEITSADEISSIDPSELSWLVATFDLRLNDEVGVIRVLSASDYDGSESEGVMIISSLEGEAARSLGEQVLGARFAAIASHPLAGVPGFLDAIASGSSIEDAQTQFEVAHRMEFRFGRLSSAGRFFASWLYTREFPVVLNNQTYEEYAESEQQFGFDPPSLTRGILDCLAEGVAIRAQDQLLLAPEFGLLAQKFFSSWRTDHLRPFQIMVSVFATLDNHGRMDEDLGLHLLRWAIRIEAWREASLLCERLCRFAGHQGQLPRMESFIRTVRPHVTDDEEKLVLDGHLVHIKTLEGQHAEALDLHQQLEARARQLPQEGQEYFINLIASLTQQVDCLLALDRPEDARSKWAEAKRLFEIWPDPTDGSLSRLLALEAKVLSHERLYEDAVEKIDDALSALGDVQGMLVAELHAEKSEYLRKLGRAAEANSELDAASAAGEVDGFNARYLHLKGLLLEEQRDPAWLDYVLESYQLDLLAERWEGVTISLLTMARIFIDNNEIPRAKERLREALNHIQAHRLRGQLALFHLLWSEVLMVTATPDVARRWFLLARDEAHISGDVAVRGTINRRLSLTHP